MGNPVGQTKLDAAKAAARLFVDSARSTDQLGLVTFSGDLTEPNDDATLLSGLLLANSTNRGTLRNLITNNIPLGGYTSIGDGLAKAWTELLGTNGRPMPPTERWITLLSDGQENEALWWASVRSNIINSGAHVNAIALGPEADQPLMQSISKDTKGRYDFVDLPPTMNLNPASAPAFYFDLNDAYTLSIEKIQGHQRLYEKRATTIFNNSFVHNISVPETGVVDALFIVHWDPAASATVSIRDPNGTALVNGVDGVEIFSAPGHLTARVPTLLDGRWQVGISAPNGTQHQVVLSGRASQGAQMSLAFGAYWGPQSGLSTNQFIVGMPMPIYISLFDRSGPILGAQASVVVNHPDGSNQTLTLLDNGVGIDRQANDGIYSVLYYRTTVGSRTHQTDGVYDQRGSYLVNATASGTDNSHVNFSRVAHGSFSIIEDEVILFDTDHDGMIDLYEQRYGCLNPAVDDANADPDFDGLTNLNEFFLGTLPCQADTDNGGEMDGSETERGANPWNASDDATTPLIDVGIVDHLSDGASPEWEPQPEAILIHYPLLPEYNKLRLMNSKMPEGPFTLVEEFDPSKYGGVYLHKGVGDGNTLYYMLYGVTSSNAISAPTEVFSATAKTDPYLPVGGFFINHGAPYASSTAVTLFLHSDLEAHLSTGNVKNEAVEMLVSNKPTFTGAAWQPYAPSLSWTLNPVGNYRMVFLKLRDDYGNESDIYQDSIILDTTGLGNIKVQVVRGSFLRLPFLVQPISRAGVYITSTGIYPPAFTDSNGNAILQDVKAGVYTILIDAPGYITRSFPDIVVTPQSTTDIGQVVLNLQPRFLFFPLIFH